MKQRLSRLKTQLTDPVQRRNWRRYWFDDVLFGMLNFITHYTLRYVPFSANAAIGRSLGALAGKLRFQKETLRTKHNLEILRPDLTSVQIDALIKKMWQNIGQVMCEYSILDKLWDKGRLSIENDQALLDCVKQKRPIIVTAAHLDNWEIAASYASHHNMPLMAMYKPVRNRFSKKISAIARSRMDIKTEPTDRYAARKMCKHLQQGGMLWLPIDDFKKGQVQTPRFGRKLSLEGSNAGYIIRLAQRYNAVIFLAKTQRLDHDKGPSPSFNVHISDPIFIEDKSKEAAQQLLKKIDKTIEHWVLETPEKWFMLHDLRL